MKKIKLLCTLLGLIVLSVLPAMAEEELPGAIQATLQHTVITQAARWTDSGEDGWFVLTETPDEIHTLYCFSQENGIWSERFCTTEALPQGRNQVDIRISDGAWDFNDSQSTGGRYLAGPLLLILQYGEDHRSIVEQIVVFQYSGMDLWNLIVLKNYSEPANIKIEENTLTYYTVADKARQQIAGSISCLPERDLRYLRLSDIPLTFQLAQDMYAANEDGRPTP